MSVRSKKKQTRKVPAQTSITSVTTFHISEGDADDSVLRDRMIRILNQVQTQELNVTVHKLKSMSINNEDKLKALVQVIFTKSVNDMQKADLYAKLCQQLSTYQVVPVGSECASFKNLLVEECKQKFKTCFSNSENDSSQQWHDKMDALGFWSPTRRSGPAVTDAAKLKKLGTVMFLGHLFKAQMLPVNMMQAVINKLLSLADEDVWECLCSLLLLIGRDMEAKKQDLALCLTKMQEMLKKRQLPANARAQLKRVIECRGNKWKKVETVYSAYSSTRKRDPLPVCETTETHKDDDDDAWAFGTLTHIVVPRRVLRNQMRQAKHRFNES